MQKYYTNRFEQAIFTQFSLFTILQFMKEDFIQMLWQNQYLDRSKDWICELGRIEVIKPGFRNRTKAGPDFEQSTIRIGEVNWVGAVEVHVRASEWVKHGHEKDPVYNSVILHVVWEKDADPKREDGTKIPTLELKNLIPLPIILKYRQLMEDESNQVPCSKLLGHCNEMTHIFMQERALIERLERKSEVILSRFKENNQNWLETFYQTIAVNLGLKANCEPMLHLAQKLPTKVLASQGWKLDLILPCFLGLSGFLSESESIAFHQFHFLKEKHTLEKPILKWEKFRIREAAWPHHRVILLAGIVSQLPTWFHNLTETKKPGDFFEALKPENYPPWLIESLANQGLNSKDLELTPFLKDSLVINTFTPLLTALGIQSGKKEYIERAQEWLSNLKSEKNSILQNWANLGIKSTSAAQSQGLIELHNEYCLQKRCMECSIGISILKK